jgi:hypothetical protein
LTCERTGRRLWGKGSVRDLSLKVGKEYMQHHYLPYLI